jgi:hypothetical protein
LKPIVRELAWKDASGQGASRRALIKDAMPSAATCFLVGLALAAAPAAPAVEEPPTIGLELAREILFEADKTPVPTTCETGAQHEQIACLLAARFAKDRKATKIAADLYERTGTVAGILAEQDFDGAYRGMLHLVPRLPIGDNRKHLEMAAAALVDIDDFFAAISREATARVRYRWKPLDVRFFESVKRATPSAFAQGWRVAYNVNGSLLHSQSGVRETLFHEIFHLNDRDHDTWSERALAKVFNRIVAKCGTKVRCLAPYSPDGIIVIGGTYYDFQPGNGVPEYAADIAKRWFVEQSAMARHEKVARPFKCAMPENAEAWSLVVDEFFAGVDRVPACPSQ